MNENYVSPLYDFAFTEIFGNQQNIENTKAFLKTLLDIPEDEYGKLTVENPILRRMFQRGKKGIVDLKLTTKSEKIIHIELQVEKVSNMRSRILYYAVRLIGDQLKSGEDFVKLHQVISIIICNHNLLEEENYYINSYQLRNEKNNSFTKLLKIVILELPKLPEAEDSAVWRWLRFLKCRKKEEFEMLAKKYPELRKPVKSVRRMSLIDQWRDYLFHKRLQKMDDRSILEQKLIDREEETMIKIAQRMKKLGESPEKIHAVTDLSLEKIEKLD